MGYITATFLDKEYSIPEDVLTYIDLLDFTDKIKQELVSAFIKKLKAQIQQGNTGLLDNEDLTPDIEYQVGRFIAKLCDSGIFNRTINDYLRDNQGYEYISKVNKAALEKIKSLLMRRLDALQEGYEGAMQRAESHVTGMGFSIWSGSFVNHAIYAAMQASTIKEQEKEASATYQREIDALCTKLESDYDKETSRYVNNEYIPNMEAALTVFAYELLDKYVADLIANGKFDGKTLDYVDIGRSNDLLKNLTLSNNKHTILENAFTACPYNFAVYMQAMKYDLLDYDSFQTAKVFKQDHHVLSFFRESWGEVSFPTKFNINYHCINVWASLTGKSSADILRGLTEQYAAGIVKAYSRVADMMASKAACRKILEDCSEDAILAGDAICKTKAHSYVDTIVSTTIWNQLTEQCGHQDLLDRIKKCIPLSVDTSNKEGYDKYLVAHLFSLFEAERILLATEIEKQREVEAIKKAEHEKQEQDRKKRNKKFVAIIMPVIAATFIFLVVLNAVIIPNKHYNAAVKLMNDGKYEEAIAAFEAMDGYKDSSRKIDACYSAILDIKYSVAIELMHNEQYNDAISAFEELQGHKDSEVKIKECRYAIAIALMDQQKYSEAISAFELISGYKDSTAKITECENAIIEAKYMEASRLMVDGKYDEALAIFENLHDYKDSSSKISECKNQINENKYNEAVSLAGKGQYDEAISILTSLGDYKDAVSLSKRYAFLNCEAGDIITFGKYEQDGNIGNGAEEIEWIVILRDGNKALVISKYCLEQMPFHSTYTPVSWRDSTIRAWLNNNFYDSAFSSEEMKFICNATFSTNGIETTDKVFLLDEDEASYLPKSLRKAKATNYVSTSYCYWFLRSTGSASNVAYVSYDGEVGYYEDVDRNWWIRPAMWIVISE